MLTAGIFVGGKAVRMGGVAKGLLAHPREPGTVIEHVIREARRVGAEPVLVGDHPAYRTLEVPFILDAVRDAGPVGGLLSLLQYAREGTILALACDMPHVPASLLSRLVEGVEQGAAAVVPRRDGRLEPLCAAYRVEAVLPHVEACLNKGSRGLHHIARASGAFELFIRGQEARWLDDWDVPADVER